MAVIRSNTMSMSRIIEPVDHNNYHRRGLNNVPLTTIAKLHANIVVSDAPLFDISKHRSVIVFCMSKNIFSDGVISTHMNIIVKLNNICVHYLPPHECRLELIYLIKQYPTIPFVIEKNIVDSNMKYTLDICPSIIYSAPHFDDFKIKRNYIFDHLNSAVRNFINRGECINSQNGHKIGSEIKLRFDNGIELSGICVNIMMVKKSKKMRTFISFDCSKLLDPSEYFCYPQLL